MKTRPIFSGLRAASRVRCSALLLISALALAAPAAFAQQQQPANFSGFDGQQVSQVDIAVRPGVSVDQMRQLIQQKSGQPFSSSAIQQSVSALQQTHLFTAVQMSMQPDQNGLHVTFVLQPADYVGVIDFTGVGTRFPYTALMQAADIPEQSPYVDGMEDQAEKGVMDYLHTRGYFSAEITPEIQRDEPHRIVNLIYHCRLKSQAKIRSLHFEGLTDAQSDTARDALKGWIAKLKRISLKPGQKYSEPRVTKAVPFIAQHLRTRGQLAPAIRLDPPTYDADTNRVDVNFKVTPGQKVIVKVQGAKLSSKNLQKLVPIYQENSVDQELVDEGESNLKGYFQAKGYFDVTTDSHTEKQDGEVDVTYTVDLGSRHKVKGVYFAGNHHFSDKELAGYVTVKKGFLFFSHGSFNQKLMNQSVASLTKVYRDAGYGSVSIQPKVEDFDPEVDITFEISEGPLDQVASLQVTGNKTQPLAALERKYPMKLQAGQPYSATLLDSDRNQLLAAYLDLGYLNASVQPSASPTQNDPHKFNVTFTVTEGPQAFVANVVMLGQHHTNAGYIEHTSRGLVRSGRPLSEGNFLQAESDLYGLGIFDWASIKPLEPIVDQTHDEVLIKVHESPLNTVDIGGGIEIIPRDGSIPVNSVAVPGLPPISIGNNFKVSQKSYFGPRVTFDFVRHNIRGRAETATFGMISSRLDQRVFATYADPHLVGSSWSSLLSISGERTTENPIYTAELAQASFQIDKALDAKRTKQLIARYSFQRTNLYNILIPGLVLPEDQHVRLSTVDAEYVRDTRDKPLDAHKGIYQTADFGITATALGANSNFLRFLGQTAFYIPVKPWLVWANNFRFGLAEPISNSYVPLSERFFTGGPDSLRGFPIDGAGPQRSLPVCTDPSNPATCTLISVPIGGDMLFIFNTEARFPLPIYHNLGGVFFYDGGNVYSNINFGEFTGNFTHTIGTGIRYNTPVGPVRVDFGYRITNIPGVKDTQYFVTLGQAF